MASPTSATLSHEGHGLPCVPPGGSSVRLADVSGRTAPGTTPRQHLEPQITLRQLALPTMPIRRPDRLVEQHLYAERTQEQAGVRDPGVVGARADVQRDRPKRDHGPGRGTCPVPEAGPARCWGDRGQVPEEWAVRRVRAAAPDSVSQSVSVRRPGWMTRSASMSACQRWPASQLFLVCASSGLIAAASASVSSSYLTGMPVASLIAAPSSAWARLCQVVQVGADEFGARGGQRGGGGGGRVADQGPYGPAPGEQPPGGGAALVAGGAGDEARGVGAGGCRGGHGVLPVRTPQRAACAGLEKSTSWSRTWRATDDHHHCGLVTVSAGGERSYPSQ